MVKMSSFYIFTKIIIFIGGIHEEGPFYHLKPDVVIIIKEGNVDNSVIALILIFT